MKRFFPNVTSRWVALGGDDVIPEEEWKGIPGRRCSPPETLLNCDRVEALDNSKTMMMSLVASSSDDVNQEPTSEAAEVAEVAEVAEANQQQQQRLRRSLNVVNAGHTPTVGAAAKSLLIRLPGHLKYHANFTLSAGVFRAGYHATQVL